MSVAKRQMKRGTELMIFFDLFTREREEGRARLVTFLRADDCTFHGRTCHSEDWTVEFLNEPGVRCERTIAWV